MNPRVLKLDDKDKLRDLFLDRFSQSLGPQAIEEQFKHFTEQYLYAQNKYNNAYGLFDSDTLHMVICQKLSQQTPTGYISNMIVRPNFNKIYKVDNGIAQCFDMAIEYAESLGYNEFYWYTVLKGWNKREETWYNSSKAFGMNYNIYIENIIPAGKRSKFDYENTLLGNKTYEVDLAIKSAKLKCKRTDI
jgi:hypothetical protein